MADLTTALRATAKDVYWLVTIYFPSPVGTRYFSERALTIAGKTVRPLVQQLPTIDASVNIALRESLAFRQGSLIIENNPSDPDRLEIGLEMVASVQGTVVDVDLALNVDGVMTEWTTMRRYRIDGYTVGTDQITFDLIDGLQQASQQVIGRLITAEDFPDAADEAFGKMYPIIFGEVDEAPCYLTDQGDQAILATDMDTAQTTVECVDASDLPASGTVWIDDEEIAYTGKSTNTLTGATRGQNGTVQAEHSAGALIREKLGTYRFLVGEGTLAVPAIVFCGERMSSGFAAVQADVNDQEATFVDVTASALKSESVAATVDVDQEGLFTYQTSNSVGVTNAANAVDTGDDRHASAATLKKNVGGTAKLCVEITSAAPSRASAIQKAQAIIEYQARVKRSGGSIEWPASTPQINVYDNTGALAKNATLARPRDEDMGAALDEIAPELTLDDSTALFAKATGINESEFQETAVYVEGYGEDSYLSGNFILTSWPQYVSASDGDPIPITDPTYSCSYYIVGTPSPSGTYHTRELKARITDNESIDDDAKITRVLVRWTVRTDTVGASVPIKTKIYIGGSTYSKTHTPDLTPYADTILIQELTGSWTKAQLLAARASIYSEDTFDPGETLENNVLLHLRFKLLGCEIVPYATFTLAGEATALDGSIAAINDGTGLVASSRMKQVLNVTAVDGWDWFDGTGGTKPKIEITFPDTTSLAEIDIYSVEWEIRELATIARAPSIAELSCMADVGTAEALPYDVILSLLTSLGDVAMFGLTDAAEFESDALFRAFDELYVGGWDGTPGGKATLLAAWQASPPWKFSRRISERAAIIDLLMQAVTDAGIRACLRRGEIYFYSGLTSVPARLDVQEIHVDEMFSQVTKRATHPDLITNDLAIYFARNLSTGDFQRVTEAEDTLSQAQSWGVKRETYDAEWIRDTATAVLLAARLVDSFAWPRLIIEAEGEYQWALLDLGDEAAVYDIDSRLCWPFGIVAHLSVTAPDTMKMAIAIPQNRTRVYTYDEYDYVDCYPALGQWHFRTADGLAAIIGWDGIRLSGDFELKAFGDVPTSGPWSGDYVLDGPIGFQLAGRLFLLGWQDAVSGDWLRVATIGNSAMRIAKMSTIPNPAVRLRVTDPVEDDFLMPQLGMADRTWTDDGTTPWTRALVMAGDRENPQAAIAKDITTGKIEGRIYTRGVRANAWRTSIPAPPLPSE